jgi:hypothetical protein
MKENLSVLPALKHINVLILNYTSFPERHPPNPEHEAEVTATTVRTQLHVLLAGKQLRAK